MMGNRDGEDCLPNDWEVMISDAIAEPDPALCNFRITRGHFLLSTALREKIGQSTGANFHSWAVWGSRKAGVTIRQEDKDQASRDATIVAGVVGGIVGVAVGWLTAAYTGLPMVVCIVVWVVAGIVTGGYSGLQLARYTRLAASELVLDGNRIVLDDIGRVTVAYLQYVDEADSVNGEALFEQFLSDLRPGPTKDGGQDLLSNAFRYYERARTAEDDEGRHQATYFANCLAILHEHIRLQPYISRSLPFLIRKCVTQRLMTFSVGEELLAVHEDVPPLHEAIFPPTLQELKIDDLNEFLNGPNGWDLNRDGLKNTRSCDWTVLRQRMGYVVNLFRSRHLQPEVTAAPYTAKQLSSIQNENLPVRPW